ncbi:MAG: hypothetical protein JO051_12040 [Acidobacteriaceae bacterium]|nr:hypothetical protein [Acidobacteriaceae bacterium]
MLPGVYGRSYRHVSGDDSTVLVIGRFEKQELLALSADGRRAVEYVRSVIPESEMILRLPRNRSTTNSRCEAYPVGNFVTVREHGSDGIAVWRRIEYKGWPANYFDCVEPHKKKKGAA